MYSFFSYLYPKKLKQHYMDLLGFFDLRYKEEYMLGAILVLGFLFSIAISLPLALKITIHESKYVNFILFLPIVFAILEFIIYFVIYLLAERTGAFVEDILPDALQLMASNLRAGMTIDRALLVSTRREFGAFNRELIRVGKEITTGRDISDSLRTIPKRIKSDKLKRTVELIILGLRAGGELSRLLEQVAENLRQQRLIEEKIRANVTVYVIFIFAAVCVGSPVLFGLSTFLVRMVTKNLRAIEIPEGVGRIDLPFQITEVSISTGFVVTYVIITLITSSIMAGFVIGLIKKGRERAGIIYIPMFLSCSLTVYFVVKAVTNIVFAGVLG